MWGGGSRENASLGASRLEGDDRPPRRREWTAPMEEGVDGSQAKLGT